MKALPDRRPTMRNRQLGITLMGLIVGAVVLIFAAVLLMKLVPSYLEYNAVKKAVSAIVVATRGRGASVADIRRAFENRSAIDDINSVKSSDLEISKEGNDYVVAVAWRREVPLFANIGVYIDFAATSRD
jgi:hypothetical protein